MKPVVALVRGGAHGIGFTTTALADFIYVTPDAFFSAPFMASGQSPEGGSTYTFVQQFGLRKANEVLLMDKVITAEEAVKTGFANEILTDLNSTDYFPDLDKIPAVKKLMNTDYRTLVNAKELLNKAKDNEKLEFVINWEAR